MGGRLARLRPWLCGGCWPSRVPRLQGRKLRAALGGFHAWPGRQPLRAGVAAGSSRPSSGARSRAGRGAPEDGGAAARPRQVPPSRGKLRGRQREPGDPQRRLREVARPQLRPVPGHRQRRGKAEAHLACAASPRGARGCGGGLMAGGPQQRGAWGERSEPLSRMWPRAE